MSDRELGHDHPDDAAVAHRRVATVAVLGTVGVVAYIGAWAVGGMLWDEYDPSRQAISELFALGAPTATRVLVSGGLVASGVGLVAFGWALHVGLPGHGRWGPALAMLSGVMTVAVTLFPCTPGCPGAGTSATDTLHVLTAGAGYLALMLAPLAVAWRVRGSLRVLAAAGWVLGGGALVLFLIRDVGLAPEYPGLHQRIFNTTADAWYLMAAGVLIGRTRTRDRTG